MSEKYYCAECKKHHFRGKIYEEHLKFKQAEQRNRIYKIKRGTSAKLSNVAYKQLMNLGRKFVMTRDKLYKAEMSKILEKELPREDLLLMEEW